MDLLIAQAIELHGHRGRDDVRAGRVGQWRPYSRRCVGFLKDAAVLPSDNETGCGFRDREFRLDNADDEFASAGVAAFVRGFAKDSGVAHRERAPGIRRVFVSDVLRVVVGSGRGFEVDHRPAGGRRADNHVGRAVNDRRGGVHHDGDRECAADTIGAIVKRFASDGGGSGREDRPGRWRANDCGSGILVVGHHGHRIVDDDTVGVAAPDNDVRRTDDDRRSGVGREHEQGAFAVRAAAFIREADAINTFVRSGDRANHIHEGVGAGDRRAVEVPLRADRRRTADADGESGTARRAGVGDRARLHGDLERSTRPRGLVGVCSTEETTDGGVRPRSGWVGSGLADGAAGRVNAARGGIAAGIQRGPGELVVARDLGGGRRETGRARQRQDDKEDLSFHKFTFQ